jgi:hypothetical protein
MDRRTQYGSAFVLVENQKTLMDEHNGLKRFSFQFMSVCGTFLKYSGGISCKFSALM